nr:DinB family protein [Granulicella sibirica]
MATGRRAENSHLFAKTYQQRVSPRRGAENEPAERYTVDGLLWHVMIHEMRHTAQIAVLLRPLGIKPPALDLLYYLPPA